MSRVTMGTESNARTTLHNNGMIEYRRITLYQISQIQHLSRAKDLLLEYWTISKVCTYPFWPIQDKSASPHYRTSDLHRICRARPFNQRRARGEGRPWKFLRSHVESVWISSNVEWWHSGKERRQPLLVSAIACESHWLGVSRCPGLITILYRLQKI